MAKQCFTNNEGGSTWRVLGSWLAMSLVAASFLMVGSTICASDALATDGLAPGEVPPSWVAQKFAHFMPPKQGSTSRGLTPQLAGSHGEKLEYWGGPVQVSPELYLLFWGGNFWNGTEPSQLYDELHFFFESLGGEIQFPYTEGWQGILTQYTNVQGQYKDAKIVAESHINAIAAPKNINNTSIENEASEWIRELKAKGTAPGPNAQFIVMTAPETTFSEMSGCGYHSWLNYEGTDYSYTFDPYAGDTTKYYESHGNGGTCNYLESNSKVHGKAAQMMFSTTGIASHEFAESVTDPMLHDEIAWQGEQKNGDVEIADLCEDEPEAIQELPDTEGRLGWTYVFLLWDDEGGNKCKLEDPPYPTPSAPSVSTEAANGLGYHQATLNGSVNPNGPTTNYYFEWGLNSASEHKTSEVAAGYGETAIHESSTITGLKPGTTYHFRIVAANWVGSSASKEETLTTLIPPPSVSNETPTNIADTSATLNGTVDPNGFSTTYQFQYWQAGKPSEVTDLPVTPEAIGSGESNVKVSKNALSLEPFTEYKWRIVATNGGGTTDGPEASVAVGPFLSLQSTPTMAGDEIGLKGVSCRGITFCMAIGSWNKEKSLELHLYGQLWNGRQWKIQTLPSSSESSGEHSLHAIACSSITACTAIADPSSTAISEKPYGERWNGTEWAVEPMPVPGSGSERWLSAVSCGSATSCVAVGSYLATTGNHVPMVESWNGTEWKVESTPALPYEAGELTGVSCTSATACTAAGWQYLSGSVSGVLIETWNGTTWKVQSAPNPSGSVSTAFRGISCTSASFCAAAGEWTEGKGEGLKTLIEQWTGTEWKTKSTPNPSDGNHLSAVTCTGGNACSAVGYSETAGHDAPLEERWNGTLWTVRATPEISSEEYLESLHSMSCASLDMCIAVGSSGPAHWQPLVEGITAPVATTEAATSVTSTGAAIDGTVDPGGWETTYHLEYGKTTEYGSTVPVPDARLGSESVAEHVSQTISALSPETTYHYRLVATNAAGVSDGFDQTFKTTASNAPPVYVNSFGSEGAGDGQFKEPTGIGLDSNGHLWVDDSNNCRVEEFSEAEAYLSLFGGICGFYYEEWESSRNLSVDNKGHIYMLADVIGESLQERTEAGVILHRYSAGEWGTVYDFAVDAHGNVWVVSNQYDDVLEYNEAGEKLKTIGTKGSGAGQFESPYGIAIGPNGNMWVTDSRLDKVVELNEKGEYIREVGTAGTGSGQYNEPEAITIDSKNDPWIVDSGNHRVEELNEKGEYLTKFGAKGTGAGEFENIGGITVSPKRVIYLTDTWDNRVEKWE